MILIIAPRHDVHALCVAQDLEKMGQPFRFVDSSRLASEGRLQFRAGQHSGSTWTCIDGQPIALDDVDTVWHRRRFLPPVAARHPISDQRYFQREWTEMISGVFASLDRAWFVNDPDRQKAAVKPLQLRAGRKARPAGFPIRSSPTIPLRLPPSSIDTSSASCTRRSRRPDIASCPRRHGRRPIATCWTTSCSRRRSFRRLSPAAASCGLPSSAIGSSPPSSGRRPASSTDVSISGRPTVRTRSHTTSRAVCWRWCGSWGWSSARST